MKLLLSQRSEVFSSLQQMMLDPGHFKWSVSPSAITRGQDIDMLSRVHSDYFFRFEFKQGSHYSIFSPGAETIIEHQYPGSWYTQLGYFNTWCGYLIRETEAIDPWAALERQSVSLDMTLSSDTPVSPFSVKEHVQVSKTLAAIEGLLLEYSKDNKNVQDGIKAEIKKLVQAAESQDRKSWFFAVVGFIASTAVSLALAPEQTRALYNLLKVGLKGVIALVG